MTRTRRAFRRPTVVAALLLAGCGGGPGEPDAPGPAPVGSLVFLPSPVPVTPAGSPTDEFDLACVGTTVHVAYAVADGVQVVRSTDAGVTWSSPTRIGVRPAEEVRLVAAGTGVSVAWVDVGLDPDAVVVNSSFDGGATWKADPDTVGVGDLEDLALVRDANAVYVAWEALGSPSHVRFARSLDGGATWGPAPLQPKDEPLGESDPRLALHGGVVRLAYRTTAASDVLRYAQSADTGASWTTSIDVATATASQTLAIGDLAAGTPGVFLTWTRASGSGPSAVRDVVGAASLVGTTWTGERLLDHDGTANGWATSGRRHGGVAVHGAGCIVGFLDATTPTGVADQVRATILTAPGGTIVPAPDGRLQTNAVDASDAYTASFAASGPRAYAVWSDNRGYVAPLQYDVWTTHSSDQGQHWAPERRISLPTAAGREPLCVCDPAHVYVVWIETGRLWGQTGTWE